MSVNKLLYKDLSYKIVGAAMEVHNTLGPGFLEKVYEEALAYELDLRGITVETQHPLVVHYKGRIVGEYIADMIVEDKIILELKAIKQLAKIHTAQAVNYLVATGYELAILLNFGPSRLEHKRVIRKKRNTFASNVANER
jgi:GxxExxY protein